MRPAQTEGGIRNRFRLLCRAAALACGVTSASGWAQERDFPGRPVRVIVPTLPGGILDTVMRVLAPKMAEVMGQNVVIDNRAGASTNIGTEIAARAAPNGYTLLINSQPLVVNPSLFPKLPFSIEKDFAPVSLVVSAPYVLIVHPSVPVKTVQDLIALAKAKPGALNYSSGGNGTNLHIAVEFLKNLTGANLVHVPYKGGGLALAAVMSGEANVSIASLAPVAPQISAGRVRGLAVTTAKRSPALPGLPTVRESGVPRYEFAAWVGLLAPAGIPRPVLERLNGYTTKAMRDPALAQRFAADGFDIIASTPEEFAAQIRTELVRWAKVIRENGIRAD